MWSLLFPSKPPASPSPPWGLKWRSSVWFVTLMVGFGVATDLFAYAVIIPVVPFRLESLGYADASARTGWLLFAYSGGLAVSTPPIAWFSEHYNARRMPLLIGLVTLVGAQIMFMLAPFYWLMALARIIQGVSSTFVWTVGLALLCDTTPESRVGQQLGLAMTGLPAGVVIAPPIGGALFQRLGFHAPFIFSIAIAAFDLIGRLLVIERKEALLWGVDPAADRVSTDQEHNDGKKPIENSTSGTPLSDLGTTRSSHPPGLISDVATGSRISSEDTIETVHGHSPSLIEQPPVLFLNLGSQLTVFERKDSPDFNASPQPSFSTAQTDSISMSQPELHQRDLAKVAAKTISPVRAVEVPTQGSVEKTKLSSMQVLSSLFCSTRALAAFANTLLYGISYSSQEPTLPLRLQDPYGLSALKVGLIYIAASVPTLISGPLAGWLSDRKGTGIVMMATLLMAVPWYIVMAIHGSFSLFIVAIVVSNFFVAAVVAPLTAELAAVTRGMPGVGYSHVYGAFNLAYGIGSAMGPLIGGQLYDHLRHHGWTAVVGLAAGLILMAATIAFVFTDETPVIKQMMRYRRRPRANASAPAGESKEG